MSAKRILHIVHSWETVRFELLNTRVSDLQLHIEESSLEPLTRRLHKELEAKGIAYKPDFYLTDVWGCPDREAVIGIPFYLADPKLKLLEEEQTGEVEDDKTVMMFLRHEAGHALNYAYRLWRLPDWGEVFGTFSKPYRDAFRPDRLTRQFVRHINAYRYGQTYAQKHPDEDFAETFAVWLTPRSGWRRRYRQWPAIHKLRYVDRLMKKVGPQQPVRIGRRLCNPVEKMNFLLADHYGKKSKYFRRSARGYVDDKLREVFPVVRGKRLVPAAGLLRKFHQDLQQRVVRWSGLEEQEATTILKKLESRSEALGLQFRPSQSGEKIMDITALAISLAIDFAYAGRFTG